MCYECQKKELSGKIKDPAMKKMFDLPEEYYKENAFLRNIKINYLKYGQLSELQLEMFKKSVDRMKKGEKLPEPELYDASLPQWPRKGKK